MVFSSIVSRLKGKNPSCVNGSKARQKPKRALQIEQLEGRRLMVADFADIIDINDGTANSSAGRNQGLAHVGNYLYFVANDNQYGNEIRWIDTVNAPNAFHTLDINPGGSGYNSVVLQQTSPEHFSNRFFLVDGNRIYFAAYDPTYGREMRWIDTDVDPNRWNTIDLSLNAGSSSPNVGSGYAIAGGKLFFAADAGLGEELQWLNVPSTPSVQTVLPPSSVTTININQTEPLEGSGPGEGKFGGFAVVGDYLYFKADDGLHGAELFWVDTSLTTPTTANLIDIRPQPGPGSNPGDNYSGFAVVGSKIYFRATTNEEGTELRWIDTAVCPSTWNDFDSNDPSSTFPGQLGGFIVVGDYLFFDVAFAASSMGTELAWVDTTDPTPIINTIDINPLAPSSFPGKYGRYAIIGTKLYFYAERAVDGYKLRELDTSNFNIETFDVTPDENTQSANGQNSFIVDGDRLFLNGHVDGVHGNELVWIDTVYDAPGDRVPHLIDIESGGGSSDPGRFGNFVIANGNLYFPVETTAKGFELGRVSIVPKVDTVVFGDGTAQRSMVTSITVTFSEDVAIDANAFVLQTRVGTTLTSYSATELAINVSTALVQGRTVATLTFSGSLIIGGSLFDGNWHLTIQSDHIHADDDTLDGNRDGTDGDDYVKGAVATDNFFRYFGDINGTRSVTPTDLAQFLQANGTTSSDPAYRAAFDYQSNGAISPTDLAQFLARNGTALAG